MINEDFFVLSTGLAGEILQKFINYGGCIAIYGDYTCYTSKPLRNFIYESNKGRNVFFVATENEALDRLVRLQYHNPVRPDLGFPNQIQKIIRMMQGFHKEWI